MIDPAGHDVMTAELLASYALALFNGLRLLGYLPQLLWIRRDRNGASAISSASWLVFAAAHAATGWYAIVVVDDLTMAFLFAANVLGCVSIIVLTAIRRAQHRAGQQERPLDRVTTGGLVDQDRLIHGGITQAAPR